MESTRGLGRLTRALGLLLYGVIGAVPCLGSPLVVPYPVAFVLWAGWIAVLFVAIRRSAEWPWASSIAALAMLLAWVLIVQLGSIFFGWTA